MPGDWKEQDGSDPVLGGLQVERGKCTLLAWFRRDGPALSGNLRSLTAPSVRDSLKQEQRIIVQFFDFRFNHDARHDDRLEQFIAQIV